jgi:uncharacterized protein YycO
MKRIILIYLLSLLFLGCKNTESSTNLSGLKDGDIIFQTSQSAQSKAIQLATHSKYSHCGIIYKDGGDFFVLEAVQPIKNTPLEEWIAKGEDGHYAVRRLRDATKMLNPEALSKMKMAGTVMIGKNYDLYFEWSNDRMYCSELVWKIYQEGTGLEVGHVQKLKDFDLTNPVVHGKLNERYGNNIPIEEEVISPSELFNSELLYTVIKN